jgi:hypothetical protein
MDPMSEMSKCCEGETPMMPSMMTEMMPQCLSMMLPKLPKESRRDFVLKMVTIMMDKGRQGMSDEEKSQLASDIIAKVKT